MTGRAVGYNVFVHPYLHVHSHFSFLEGLNSPVELAQKAAELGIPALALTDTHNLTGAVEFANACQDAGIQPIHGIEVLVNAPAGLLEPVPGSLVLLAENERGWQSLCEIASEVQPPEPLPFEFLASHSQGLVCLSGGKKGSLQRQIENGQRDEARAFIQELNSVFHGSLYLELQNTCADDLKTCLALASLANRLKIPLAASHPVYFIRPEDARLQKLVTAIRLNTNIEEVPEADKAPQQAYFPSPEELNLKFEAFPSALDNTKEIAARCRGGPPIGINHFPVIETPDGKTAEESLRERAFEGALQRYGAIKPEIESRLEHELGIINQLGYAPIFLIMQEMIAFARIQGIPTASRGSASSSLVAHCLGITTPDPLRHNLYFERFLNPARKTPPDIDTDLNSRRRDEVIHYAIQRYGPDRVAMVSTISRLRDRSALREVAKAYGLPQAKISELANALPWRWRGPQGDDDGKDPFELLHEQFKQPLQTKIINDAAALVDLPDHLSVHPGGVVITPVPMHEIIPTQPAPKGVPITQFDLEPIEQLGLVKFDLLGIRGLSVLGEVAGELAKKKRKRPLDTLRSGRYP